MNFEDFRQWLWRLVGEGRLGSAEYDDLLEQRRLFDKERDDIQNKYRGHFVGFIAGDLFVAKSVQEMLGNARNTGRQVYYEAIPNKAQLLKQATPASEPMGMQ